MRSFRYPLNPTRSQERTLRAWLRLTREVYNAALQERRDAWGKQHVSVGYTAQSAQVADIRAERADLATVPVVVLRGALRRLDKAFKAFFRRCKAGERPGYPRFRGASRWSSIRIDDLTRLRLFVAGGKRIALPLLGKIKFKQHRPLEGTPKAITITLDAWGRWFVTLACVDVPAKPLPASEREVGVDLGLLHFAATSDGATFTNPRPLAAARRQVERAQRRVSRRKRGSKRRRRAIRTLARRHAHVANIRREHHITVARTLVSEYGTIYVEKLNIRGLARGMLAKSVHDVAWGNFLHWLRVKAESAGREVIEVDPRGTSQTCPDCGAVAAKALSERVHRCDCGLVCDRDVAAARVILRLGRSLRGVAPVVARTTKIREARVLALRNAPGRVVSG